VNGVAGERQLHVLDLRVLRRQTDLAVRAAPHEHAIRVDHELLGAAVREADRHLQALRCMPGRHPQNTLASLRIIGPTTRSIMQAKSKKSGATIATPAFAAASSA